MELTEGHLYWLKVALMNPRIAEHVRDFWILYDEERENGNLPEIDPGNPHTPTLFFALVGYPFAVRGGLAEMQVNLDAVIEKLSKEIIESPWMP